MVKKQTPTPKFDPKTLLEKAETQRESEQIYYKLPAGTTEKVLFTDFDNDINYTREIEGKTEAFDAAILKFVNTSGDEKLFIRRMSHKFIIQVLELMVNGVVAVGHTVMMKKGDDPFGEYTMSYSQC